MFYQGQRVVAQVTIPHPFYNNGLPLPVDGKSYYITNANYRVEQGFVFVEIAGFSNNFWQGLFIPYDTDKALEDEIFEALKEDLKIKI